MDPWTRLSKIMNYDSADYAMRLIPAEGVLKTRFVFTQRQAVHTRFPLSAAISHAEECAIFLVQTEEEALNRKRRKLI